MSYITESDTYQYQESYGPPTVHSDVVAHLGDEYADVPAVFLRLTWCDGVLAAVVFSRPNDLLPRGAVTAWAAVGHGANDVAMSALIQGF